MNACPAAGVHAGFGAAWVAVAAVSSPTASTSPSRSRRVVLVMRSLNILVSSLGWGRRVGGARHVRARERVERRCEAEPAVELAGDAVLEARWAGRTTRRYVELRDDRDGRGCHERTIARRVGEHIAAAPSLRPQSFAPDPLGTAGVPPYHAAVGGAAAVGSRFGLGGTRLL